MKILTFLVGLIIMSYFILQVQANNKTDSLLLLIKSEKEDTSKVNILNDVARKIMYANPDSSILLSNHALDIINKTNNLPEFWKAYLKSQCLKNLATFQYLKGNYTRSLDFYLKSLAILEKSENVFEPNYTAKTEGLKSKILSNIGALYDEQEEYQKALDYYFKALKIVEVIKNKDEAASYLPGNIGVTYKNIAGTTPKTIGNFHKIDSLFQKALNFFLVN